MYRVSTVVANDLVPGRLLEYCTPSVDTTAIRQRAVTLLSALGDERLAREIQARDGARPTPRCPVEWVYGAVTEAPAR